MPIIKPGYLLKIKTYENDADSPRTTEHSGLSESDCRFMIKVAQLFKSKNRDEAGYGNSDVRAVAEHLPDVLEAIVLLHKAAGFTVPKTFDTELWADEASEGHDSYREDYTTEVLYDLIGTWCDGEYWRYLDGYEVFFVPEPIQNVTEHFR
jgi:hypothetical protein